MLKNYILILVNAVALTFLMGFEQVLAHEPFEINLVQVNNRCIRACKARYSEESVRYPMDQSCVEGCKWSHKFLLEKLAEKPVEPVHQESVKLTY